MRRQTCNAWETRFLSQFEVNNRLKVMQLHCEEILNLGRNSCNLKERMDRYGEKKTNESTILLSNLNVCLIA